MNLWQGSSVETTMITKDKNGALQRFHPVYLFKKGLDYVTINKKNIY